MQKIPTLKTEHDIPRSRVDNPLTNSMRWRRFRKRLYRDRSLVAAAKNVALCVDCAVEGKPYGTAQMDGHHIKPVEEYPELTYVADNVEFVCKRHHRWRNNWEEVPHDPLRHIVYGKPGSGKTTLVRQHASPTALVWDMDAVAEEMGFSPRYPRPSDEVQQLERWREQFVREVIGSKGEAWMIFRWPDSAWRNAVRIDAGHVIRV